MTMRDRPLRADARRNRDRLVAAAADVVAEQGSGASLEEVARRAGVGSATLHRHFADRRDLLAAVFAGHVDELCAAGDDLLRGPRAGEALVDWLRAVLRHACRHRGLAAAALAAAGGQGVGAAAHVRIRAAGERLLARAQAAGEVRADLRIGELLQLVNAISLAAEREPQAALLADRLLSIAVEGVRPG